MRRTLVVVTLAVVLAGCAGVQMGSDDPALEGDIGTVDGVAYDADISIRTDDGLNETELSVLTARAMARIEVIRELNFEKMVDIEIVTRQEYLDRRASRAVNGTDARWENQFWEALFVVGEDRNATQVREKTLGGAVQGYYAIDDDQIVVVTDGDEATIDRETLVHELVHALQDQQFGLDTSRETQDGQLGRNGLIEGAASLVPELYLDRCGSDWQCPTLPDDGTASSGERERGIILVIIQPYEQGPAFVEELQSAGGWERIDEVHENLPASSEQVIHPEKYPDEQPVSVTVPDRSTSEWSRFDRDQIGDTMGEASLYAMLLNSGAIATEQPYSYDHEASAGWAGDRFVPYQNDRGEFGYVWQLEFDTTGDAEEFEAAYLDLLEERGALERGKHSFVISDGPFEDAFRVTRDGTTVRIVNGPTVESLSAIHDG